MRQSVSHTGSFFLAEMWRMVSSLKPGGVDSDSTSVTKPYLYSCLTRLSIVSVAVLIVKLLFPRAIRAKTVNGHFVALRQEPARQRHAGQGRRQIHVKNRLARGAVKMPVLVHVRAEPRRTAIHRHLPGQPAFYQSVEAVVNRGHGNL